MTKIIGFIEHVVVILWEHLCPFGKVSDLERRVGYLETLVETLVEAEGEGEILKKNKTM